MLELINCFVSKVDLGFVEISNICLKTKKAFTKVNAQIDRFYLIITNLFQIEVAE